MGGLNIDNRLFRKTVLGALGALILIVGIMAYNASVYGLQINLPSQHIGGFMIEAASIEGSGFILMPWIGDSNDAGGDETHMMIRVQMCELTIKGMKITKVMSGEAIRAAVQAATGGAYDALKIQISSADENALARGSGLVMNTSAMSCDLADFQVLKIISPTNIKANYVVLDNAQIITHFQSAETMTIPFMVLAIEPCSSSDDPCL